MPLPRRAIIACTSATANLHGEGHKTGLFISEALHPFNVFKKAGFEVDVVSETGSWYPDWLSLQPSFLTEEDRKQWEDHDGEFRKKIDNMSKPVDIDGSKYGIFFASAGHAALIDYPDAIGLKKIATEIWVSGGIVSTVCHGPAIFPGIIDPATNKSIINGKTITGFTTQAEDDMKITGELRSWGKPLVEETAETLGAKYVRPPGVWDSFHVTDGRVVTGTNPESATETAEAAVVAFEAL